MMTKRFEILVYMSPLAIWLDTCCMGLMPMWLNASIYWLWLGIFTVGMAKWILKHEQG